MNLQPMLRRFRAWREAGRPLVLASVYETAGSTYSKAGTHMLIDADGDFQGLLSGGCLEGDLAERAATVVASGRPQAVTYDLGGADDELFGLGVGCDGTMRIFLQALVAPAYEPFASVAACLQGEEPAILAIVVGSDSELLEPGASALIAAGGDVATSMSAAGLAAVAPHARRRLEAAASGTDTLRLGEASAEVLFAAVVPPPRLLVLGAGLDAVPLVDLAALLGWRVTVRDHRPGYLERGDLDAAQECLCAPAEALAADAGLERYAAAVIMSHHLATDRVYLRALAATAIPYLGLLGPRHRRRRLLEDLAADGETLAARLHGPAGLDLGASGAEAIALSIVAEIQAELAGRASGRRLGPPAEH